MHGKDLFQRIAQGAYPPSVPFVPTIYEHGARIIGKTPAKVAVDKALIVESQLASYELYRHDLVSVGLDIYNIEVEALGLKIHYPTNEELPFSQDVLVTCREDLALLRPPNPTTDGRMPIFLEACSEINKKIGRFVGINGTVVGPFTLAAILRGFEHFIMDMIDDPEFALLQMRFAKEVALRYAQGFLDTGVGLSINESWITPPLLSPSLFRQMVLPLEQALIQDMKSMGFKSIALISGGNTTAIASDLISTGTSLLMADFMTDQNLYKNLCRQHHVLLRGSIDPKIVEKGTENEMSAAVDKVFNACSDYHGFVFGCGIVSYDTPPEQVLRLKKMVAQASLAIPHDVQTHDVQI